MKKLFFCMLLMSVIASATFAQYRVHIQHTGNGLSSFSNASLWLENDLNNARVFGGDRFVRGSIVGDWEIPDDARLAIDNNLRDVDDLRFGDIFMVALTMGISNGEYEYRTFYLFVSDPNGLDWGFSRESVSAVLTVDFLSLFEL